MNKRAGLLVLLCALITACASQTWDSYEGKTQQEFYTDKAECSALSRSGGNTVYYNPSPTGFASGFMNGVNIANASAGSQIFNDCMYGRGWFLSSSN